MTFETGFNNPAHVGDVITCQEGAFTASAQLYNATGYPTPPDKGAFYCGVAVTVSFEGKRITGAFSNARWGLEANPGAGVGNERLLIEANRLLPNALSDARAWVRRLTDAHMQRATISVSGMGEMS
jgi:hypothetical protein